MGLGEKSLLHHEPWETSLIGQQGENWKVILGFISVGTTGESDIHELCAMLG